MSLTSNKAIPNANVNPLEARRAFLQKALGVISVTGSASILSSANMTYAADFATGRKIKSLANKLFTTEQMTALFAITDTILPRTDTPSGSELDCHNFVQHQLLHCHSKSEQSRCESIINKIDDVSQQLFAKPFALLSPAEQNVFLVNLENGQKFSDDDIANFKFLKALLVFGFFTTEIGATQALNYQAVPGGFIGSIPSDKNTKSWGSIDYY